MKPYNFVIKVMAEAMKLSCYFSDEQVVSCCVSPYKFPPFCLMEKGKNMQTDQNKVDLVDDNFYEFIAPLVSNNKYERSECCASQLNYRLKD